MRGWGHENNCKGGEEENKETSRRERAGLEKKEERKEEPDGSERKEKLKQESERDRERLEQQQFGPSTSCSVTMIKVEECVEIEM